MSELPVVGLPDGTPARPKDSRGYLPVHDLPMARDEATMAPADQARLQNELVEARTRSSAAAAAPR